MRMRLLTEIPIAGTRFPGPQTRAHLKMLAYGDPRPGLELPVIEPAAVIDTTVIVPAEIERRGGGPGLKLGAHEWGHRNDIESGLATGTAPRAGSRASHRSRSCAFEACSEGAPRRRFQPDARRAAYSLTKAKSIIPGPHHRERRGDRPSDSDHPHSLVANPPDQIFFLEDSDSDSTAAAAIRGHRRLPQDWEGARALTPVTFPPGRARLATSLVASRSPPYTTIGISDINLWQTGERSNRDSQASA
jgi:hypothetical protein